jgi:hypothetical protein
VIGSTSGLSRRQRAAIYRARNDRYRIHSRETQVAGDPSNGPPGTQVMAWTTTYVVIGDGEDPEECANETDAIIRTSSRPDAKVVRIERGARFETRQTIWPVVGPEFTCPRDSRAAASGRNSAR